MRDRISKCFQFFIKPSRFLFSLFALGNIHNRSEHKCTFMSVNRREADLHRKLSAILAESIEVTPYTHRAHLRTGEEICAMPRMNCCISQWHKPVNTFADQFVPVITER